MGWAFRVVCHTWMVFQEVKMILKTSTDSAVLNKLVKAIIPTLTYDLYKGQCGRIGVVGGSAE